MKKKTFIVIPAYNEEKTIKPVIKELMKKGFNNIIVVDDGSKDKTKKLAESEKVILYNHIINRGLGAALGTGIKGAIENDADIIVTCDADGQHSPNDIKKIIKPLQGNKVDVVIGSRMLNPKEKGMPFIRRVANFIGNLSTFFLFGVWTTDSQSGLRGFSKKAAKIINIRAGSPPGMEASSEIIKEIGHHKLKFVEVPIQAIYTDYSLNKGQSFLVGIKTLVKLIIKKIMN